MEWILGCLSFFLFILLFIEWRKKYHTISNYNPIHREVNSELSFSIVICIKGNAPQFLKYLDKIISQKHKNFEIILITKEISNSLRNSLEKLSETYNYIFSYSIEEIDIPYLEKKQALNIGISSARYDWIITIDDDCYPENEYWLSSLNNFIQNNSSDIVLGLSPYISQNSLINQWIRYDTFQVAINYIYYTILGKPYMGVGRNMAFKKELWSKEYLDTFKELGSGDDSTLVQYYHSKKEVKIMMTPSVYSFPKLNFKEWFFQKIRHIQKGKYLKSYTLKELAYLPFLTFLFWFVNWLWISYFAFHFFIFLIVVIYLSFKMYYSYKIAKIFQWKVKPVFYTLLFDVFYNFGLLCLPFISIFINKKWR